MEENVINESIKNECVISNEELVKISKKSIIYQTLSFSIIGIVFFVVGLIFLILRLASKIDSTYLILILVLMICGALIALLPFIITIFMPAILKRQNQSIYEGFKSIIIFSNDTIDATTIASNAKSNNVFEYKHLYKVKIYDDIVFMYLNSNVLYMFKLSGFINDDEKNLVMNRILKNKVKNK
ncbi:MAG: hypothetical protein ACI35W_00680 [Anaeroplasmataceae bacterium]